MDAGESDALRKYNSIYLEIIMRYKDHIEESESLNASDLPKLVTPGNETVEVLCNSFKSSFGHYTYEKDFPSAARAAFQYVRHKITEISLPIQFWQNPEDTVKREAGDAFDKAVLLCSILVNLGNADSKAVIVINGEERFFIVYAVHDGGITAFDINDSIRNYKSVKEMLGALGAAEDNGATAYEFNNVVYNDLL